MAAAVRPKPKTGIEEVHRAIANRLRRYSATSIADLALHMLWNPPADKLEELRGAPWLTLLLVKWALQDNGVGLRVGKPIPPQVLDQLRQQLWDIPSVGEDGTSTNVFLMLRSLLHVQVEFQRAESWGFLRWPALYARLDAGHKSRRQFREVMGMEPDAFLDMTYGLYAAVMARRMPLGPDYLSPWRATYGESVDRFYSLFVRDLPSLRAELQKDVAQRIRGRQELYEFPYLKRFPLLRLRDGRMHCWHPLVFARGMEDAVHLRLSELGKDYVDSFSRVFEAYVTELATGSGMPALDERAYKAVMGGDASSVEVILSGVDCNIFVEAKMSLFADDVLLQDSEAAVFNKTKRIREGIGQGWKVADRLREDGCPLGAQFRKPQDFLLVVTSRELILGGGEKLQRLFAPGMFDYPNAAAQARLPLTNVFIVSIEDFENAMGCVAAGEVDLSEVLKEAAVANQRGDTAKMFFADFLAKHTNKWTQPECLVAARRASEARMAKVLGAPSDAFEAVGPVDGNAPG